MPPPEMGVFKCDWGTRNKNKLTNKKCLLISLAKKLTKNKGLYYVNL